MREYENVGHNPHMESRLGTLEQEVTGLKTDVTYIRQQIGEISHNFNQFINSSKTKFGVLAAWGVVIVSLLLGYTSLSHEPFNNFMELSEKRHTLVSQALEQNIRDKKEFLEWVITNQVKIEYLEKQIDAQTLEDSQHWTRSDHDEYSKLIEQQINLLQQQLSKIPCDVTQRTPNK